jgi:hypothetical protein
MADVLDGDASKTLCINRISTAPSSEGKRKSWKSAWPLLTIFQKGRALARRLSLRAIEPGGRRVHWNSL